VKMLRKRQAGGLSDKVLLAVTPNRIHAFKLKTKGRDFKAEDEVASWERTGAKVSTGSGGGMTTLTIESPSGEETTLVAIGVRDDPVSTEVIDLLQGASPATV
jgi:hypothetical protein